jgi:hypothetical protein
VLFFPAQSAELTLAGERRVCRLSADMQIAVTRAVSRYLLGVPNALLPTSP